MKGDTMPEFSTMLDLQAQMMLLLATGVAVVLAGMPMGGTTPILAEKYGADSTFASKCTAISTVLSLITTPLWCLVV